MNSTISEKLIVYFWIFCFFISVSYIKSDFSVIFFDVGQGDAILIKTPSRKQILIDGGGDLTIVQQLGKNLGYINNSLEISVLTHPHADHINGLVYTLNRTKSKVVLYNDTKYDVKAFDEFNLYCLKNGNCIDVGSINQFVFKIDDVKFYVFAPDCSEGERNINNCSVILLVEYGSKKILLMGDAEHEQENWLLDTYADSLADIFILKAGHHCSRTASGDRFLKTTKPLIVICSLGKENSFGHPHVETLERIKKMDQPFLGQTK